jgi:hypothetical protein
LNEILKYHNFPQTGCDLKKYLETCNELSTRGDSGVKTDSKFSSFINETHQKQPRLSQQQQPSQQIAYQPVGQPPKTLNQALNLLKNAKSYDNNARNSSHDQIGQVLANEGSPKTIDILNKHKQSKISK